MLNVQTPLGIDSSTRLLQGSTASGNHFQVVPQEALVGRVSKLLQWLDDLLNYAKSEHQLLNDIEAFLCVCNEQGFKIHAAKT